ncbi:MAG: helix-turn-helix transcriptional regulator [Peptococcaceae bacterium]|nr:helix-turn-helix transcriptional regulator [Peptococcaceae bacterium]
MSMYEAARSLGVPVPTYTGWERFGRVPRKKYWATIAKFIGTKHIDYIIEMQKHFNER